MGAVTIRPLHTPGFTLGAAVFHASVPRDKNVYLPPGSHPHSVAFTGNTLFFAGAGKLMEQQTVEDQYKSLIMVIGKLPSHTELYYGHEYALDNLQFAHALAEGKDPDIDKALEEAQLKRDAFTPCVPGFLEDEYLFNPFMRVNHMVVQKLLGASMTDDPTVLLRRIRER